MQLLQYQKLQHGLIDPFLNNLGDTCEAFILNEIAQTSLNLTINTKQQ